jgi:FixJ family two-component response regulator
MNGLDVQELLVRSENPLPVVFITAHDEVNIRERALRAGAVTFLRKPFDEECWSKYLLKLSAGSKRTRRGLSDWLKRAAACIAALAGTAGSLRAGQPPATPAVPVLQSQRPWFPAACFGKVQ